MLAVRNLTKRYGARTALDSLTLDIPARQFVALLGPNGAGKSTLFQVLTGLFAPDAGEVEVAGRSMRRSPAAALAQIGVVFQQMSLDLDLTVARNLQFHADLHGLHREPAMRHARADAQRLGLAEESLARPVRELSGGNRRKVELVRALMHQPSVLLMDEATVGLDIKSRRDMLDAMGEAVRERSASVLWATHLVEEALQADRVLILHRGKLLADGTPAEVAMALGAQDLESGFLKATA